MTKLPFFRPGLCLFLLVTMCAIMFSATSQAQQRIHRTFDPTDGLVQSQIHALHEDRQGYLWIGTLGGVSRWDGNEFVNFTVEDGLGSRYVRCMTEDTEGRILVGHFRGGMTVIDGDSLWTIGPEQGLPNESVHSLLALPDGVVLISTDAGLSSFQAGAVAPFDSTSGLTDLLISGMVQRPDGTIVLSTWGQGLVVAGGSPLQRLSQPEGLPDPRLTGLCLGDDGLVFCSPNMSGVWVLDGEDIRPLADNSQLAELDVLSIFHTADGTLYLGTENQGINIWQDGELDTIGPANGLLGEVVKCFEEGSDGMIYVGTWGGLSIHDRDRMVVINSD